MPPPTAAPDVRTLLVDDLDAGFAEVVRHHQRLLHTVALRTAADPADAEDLAAEAFLRAYRALRGYDADRIAALEVRPWLLTVLLNVRRNDARSAARRPRSDSTDPTDPADPTAGGLLDRPAPGPGPGDHTGTDPALAAAVAALPRPQRIAVVLRHVVDLPVVEVAAALGCAEGTARSHVSRGLAALRAALAGPDHQPDQPDDSGRSSS